MLEQLAGYNQVVGTAGDCPGEVLLVAYVSLLDVMGGMVRRQQPTGRQIEVDAG